MKLDPKPNVSKSLTSSAASQMKRAFGLQSSGGSSEIQRSSSFKPKKNPTISDVLRVQMRISDQSEMRIRKALTRATAVQVSNCLKIKLNKTEKNYLLPFRFLDRAFSLGSEVYPFTTTFSVASFDSVLLY